MPAQRVGRLILVDGPAAQADRSGQTVVYVRVCSADQRSDVDRQVARVTSWATGQQGAVDNVVTEVGSALNGRRRKFLGLLRDPAVRRVVVEHRDRFCRSVLSMSKRLLPPRAVSWWWSIRSRSMTIWCGT